MAYIANHYIIIKCFFVNLLAHYTIVKYHSTASGNFYISKICVQLSHLLHDTIHYQHHL